MKLSVFNSSFFKRLLVVLLVILSTNASAQSIYAVTASKLNVRVTASASGAVVGSLVRGTEITVNSISNGWAEIQYQGHNRYVKADFLQKNENQQTEIPLIVPEEAQQTEPERIQIVEKEEESPSVKATSRNGSSTNTFVEFQPVIVCAKGAKPIFDFLFGTTFGLKQFVSAGFGTGLSTNFHGVPLVPVFARVTLSNKEWGFSPFMTFDAGYDFNFKAIKMSNFRLSPTIGVKTRDFYLGVGYLAAITTGEYGSTTHCVNFKVGYEFGTGKGAGNGKAAKQAIVGFFKRSYVGIEAGGGLGLSVEKKDYYTTQIGSNFHIEASWNFPVIRPWHIGIGTGFRQAYSHSKATETREYGESFTDRLNIIPLYLRNRVFLLKDDSQIRPFVGVDLGIDFGWLIYVNEIDYNGDLIYESENFKSFFFRPQAGVLFKDKFSIALSYRQSKIHISDDAGSEEYGFDFKMKSLELTLGYRF